MSVKQLEDANKSVVNAALQDTSNERLKNQSILVGVVGGVAGSVFAGDLVIVGLVALGIFSLPFTWPVLAGVLVGSAVVGAVAFAVFYSSKNQIAETVDAQQQEIMEVVEEENLSSVVEKKLPEAEEIKKVVSDVCGEEGEVSVGSFLFIEQLKAVDAAQQTEEERFILQAKEACRNLNSGEMLTDNTVQFVVLAMSIFYDRECDLTLSVGPAFQYYTLDFVKPFSEEKSKLRIRTVCIEGQGENGILLRIRGKAGYIENHATCFVENEYFDPKGFSYKESLDLKEPKTGVTVRKIGEGFDGDIVDYPHEPVQDFLDITSCGVHVCRYIEQYFKGTQNTPLIALSKHEIAEVRKSFASLIETCVIKGNKVKVSAIVAPSSNSSVSYKDDADDFDME